MTKPRAPKLGAMMCGGNPADGRQLNDLYQTPAEGTDALLAWLSPNVPRKVWEPSCGEGRMVDRLRRAGCHVLATDKYLYAGNQCLDFFEQQSPPSGWEDAVIITNPPWGRAKEYIIHAQTVLRPKTLMLLLKSTFFNTASNAKLYQNPETTPWATLPLTFRLDFQDKGRPVLDCTWYIWSRERVNSQIVSPIGRAPTQLTDTKSDAFQLAD